VTREQLSTVLDRWERWTQEMIDYHASDHPYAYLNPAYREELFNSLVEALGL
jgi:hypothetical protein